LPSLFRFNRILNRGQIRIQRRRVRVWVLRRNIVHIPVSGKRRKDIVVAETLGARADSVGASVVARDDLVFAAAGFGPGGCGAVQGGLGDERVVGV